MRDRIVAWHEELAALEPDFIVTDFVWTDTDRQVPNTVWLTYRDHPIWLDGGLTGLSVLAFNRVEWVPVFEIEPGLKERAPRQTILSVNAVVSAIASTVRQFARYPGHSDVA